ncbi:ZrgA family zinc uptake protein [Rheinheimera salexigens]|uniref:DUF2796 domain-containing protein n=1 Tax=Rheinheimera salexigens TaxID=1628148 RepID=A0A1E7Q938_9GAMM|nr:DUF2796 domain-containing protein [Rheinheimera salexigens]OEY70699.1 hypothetical protein BI198_14865 [Rheinheimera salexigens]
MNFKTICVSALLAFSIFSSAADEQYAASDTSVLGAHEHGKALLMLVVDGNEMQLALQSAAQTIVGFEQKASTAEQIAEIAAAIEVFNRGEWFQFNADANCEVTAAETNTDLLDAKFNRGHADFYANYQLLCQQPARLKQLDLQLFSLLPSLQQLQVQWVINGRQGAADANLNNSTIRF